MSGQQARNARRAPEELRRLATIEENLHDLARDQRWLQEQIHEILERLDSGEPGAAARVGASGRRAAARPSTADAPPWKRVLRGGLRSVLGLARRVWQGSDPVHRRRILVEPAGENARHLPAIGEDFDASDEVSELSPARLELARLTLAAEDLAFLEIPLDETSHRSALLVRREHWHPEHGLDAASLVRGSRRRPLLGKVVGGRSGRHTGLRAVGDYRIADKHLPYRHRVRRLDGLAAGENEEGGRETVLILASSALAGGVDRAVADLARALSPERRVGVLCLARSDVLQDARIRQLETLAELYPLADFLPGPVLAPAVAYLARRHRAVAIVHLGDGDLPEDAAAALAALDEPPPVLDRPPVCGVAPAPPSLDGARATLRRSLGVRDEQVLVVMASDLVARKRPEDFLALAHRLRDDERFVFALAGRGPLAGTLDDLERYLAPPRFHRLEAPVLPDLLAAADLACTPSEAESLPYFPLAALAAGLPVVACRVDGLEDLLAGGPCGVTVPVADLDAMEEAIRALADEDERRRLGENGRRVAREFRLGDVMRRFGEVLDAEIGGRTSS